MKHRLLSFSIPALAALALSALLVACFPTSETTDEGNTPLAPTDTSLTADSTAHNVTWFTSATAYRGQDSLQVAYVCPDSGTASIVWGSDVYTDDSSVCTAAVHAGKITFASGGRVVIKIRPGQTAYTSSTRNGVTTLAYGVWIGSYVFL
jgi:hypothetical protein